MSVQSTVKRTVRLPQEQANRLRRLAQDSQQSEEQIIAKALDILFYLNDILDVKSERKGWSLLSEASLARVWDNEQDAAYDNWQKLYDVPTR